MQLILFDIDQTLMETGGVGMRCLSAAVRSHLGEEWDGFAGIHPDGKTDPQIVLEALAHQGWTESHLETLWVTYIEQLASELGRPDERRRLKPGVGSLLAALAARETPVGLLTGNLEPTARLKLQALAINHYFPVGGFGSDAPERTRLGPIAVARAKAHYQCEFDDVWVIGDTPLDVLAAHAIPARALAVATGRNTTAMLQAAGADAVLEDLGDLEGVLKILRICTPH